MTFLQAFYIGIANNLPTGPVSAYLIATRAENSYRSIISVVLGALLADLIHLYLVGSTAYAAHPGVSNPFVGIGLSLFTALIGAHMIYRGFHPRPKKQNTRKDEKLIQIFFYACFLNLINPFAILSMLAFMNTSSLLPIPQGQTLIVYVGYTIASLGMWSLYGFIVQKYIDRLELYTKNIVIICGITIVMFGFGYAVHQSIQIIQPYTIRTELREKINNLRSSMSLHNKRGILIEV